MNTFKTIVNVMATLAYLFLANFSFGASGLVWKSLEGVSLKKISAASDGGFVVGGLTNSAHKPFIAKFDNGGNISWQKSFEKSASRIDGLAEVEANNFFFVFHDDHKGFIARVDQQGIDWVYELTIGDNDANYNIQSFVPTGNDGFLIMGRYDMPIRLPHQENVVGYVDAYGNEIKNFGTTPTVFIIKINSLGQMAWKKNYYSHLPYELKNGIYDIRRNNDWGKYVFGTHDGGDILSTYHIGSHSITRIGNDGLPVWRRWYDFYDAEDPIKCVEMDDGSLVFLSKFFENEDRTHDYLKIFKTDGQGNILWSKAVDGPVVDDIGITDHIVKTPDNGLLVISNTKSFGAGGTDLWILRFDDQGNILWQKTLGTQEDELIVDAAIGQNGLIGIVGLRGDKSFFLEFDPAGLQANCVLDSNSQAQNKAMQLQSAATFLLGTPALSFGLEKSISATDTNFTTSNIGCSSNSESALGNTFSGWWYDSDHPGTGLALEIQGNRVFLAWFIYDNNGQPIWYSSGGTINGNQYTGDLLKWNGWAWGTNYSAPSSEKAGMVTLTFDSGNKTLNFSAQVGEKQFSDTFTDFMATFAPGGQDTRVITGWWYDPTYNGMGFFLDAHGGKMAMVWYNYRDNHTPRWWTSTANFPNEATEYSGSLDGWSGGQCLGCEYSMPARHEGDGGNIVINFTDQNHAVAQVGSVTLNLERFSF